ncbi:MAG: hypothetical protein RLZZ04_1712 [Cyanobacteriota bacterium]|jgi:hypothetical protein
MNSEIPYNPESENSENSETTIFESSKSSDTPQDTPQDDGWSSESSDQRSPGGDFPSSQNLGEAQSPITSESEILDNTENNSEDLAELELPESGNLEETLEELLASRPESNSENNLENNSANISENKNSDLLDEQPNSAAQESTPETELFVDSWLDESVPSQGEHSANSDPKDEINQLEQQKVQLQSEISALKAYKEQLLLHQLREAQENMGRMIEEGTQELRERKTALRIEIEKLERRQERLNQEMRSNFAGSSKELAIRVQGFKEYLVGSLQDLATAAEKLELVRTGEATPRNRERVRNSEDPRRGIREGRDRDRIDTTRNPNRNSRSNEPGRGDRPSGMLRDRNDRTERSERPAPGQFSEPTFADQSRRICQLLDKYCNSPDYYGAPWQLRRTFDQSQARKVQDWFFSQGGRGAIDSTGSRLQNILVASATISILHNLYRDRTQVLVLTDTPENLGEWRKGLEDCLGISRRDFGTNSGVVLFDSPDILVQRAERLLADKLLPIIIIDETEEQLNLSVLKFPIWLAFASNNRSKSSNYLY